MAESKADRSVRRYRWIVRFDPDRPNGTAYTREVVTDTIYPGDAVRAALDRFTTEHAEGGQPVTFWQAQELKITVQRTP